MQPGVEGESHRGILELRTRLFLNAVEDFEKPLQKNYYRTSTMKRRGRKFRKLKRARRKNLKPRRNKSRQKRQSRYG
jgi:hypothetical protein